MQTYLTKDVATLGQGILALTPRQAAIRSHALAPLGGGFFEILQPVQFKAGESFGYNLPLPKVLAAIVDLESEPEGGPDTPLEDLEPVQLFAFAEALGLKPHPNTGKAKLIAQIQAKQDELLAEQEQAQRDEAEKALKATRIAELEAKGSDLSAEEKAELESLTA